MTPDRERINRRTMLRGTGVAMALPWLESIPVWGGEPAATAPPGGSPRCSWATGSAPPTGRPRARGRRWS